MPQRGGYPFRGSQLHRALSETVKLLTKHVVRGDSWVQWQSAMLVMGLLVIHDWFEMGCHLSLNRREHELPFVPCLHPEEEEG